MKSFPDCFFVTGIGTDVGKTVVSTILCKALNAEYWKPIQSGGLDFTDSNFVQSFGVNVHPESYRLKTPASPHYAAELDGVSIDLEKFQLPAHKNRLLIEGAGGIMVPLNKEDLVLDLVIQLAVPVIVVSKNYLGSINHTLLSCEMLSATGVEIAGIIFNGETNAASENFILKYTNLNLLGRVPAATELSKEFMEAQALAMRESLSRFYKL